MSAEIKRKRRRRKKERKEKSKLKHDKTEDGKQDEVEKRNWNSFSPEIKRGREGGEGKMKEEKGVGV